MQRRVELLPRARKDIEALPLSIQDQIIAKIELLRDFPELGPAMVDAFQGYRAILTARNSYRVVYRILADGLVEVAYIRHCARQTRLRLVRERK